jgi:hypothetical protein
LVGLAAIAVGQLRQCLRITEVEVAHAPVANAVSGLQGFEPGLGLAQRLGVWRVQQIDVDVFESQALDTARVSRLRAGAIGAVRVS